MYIKKLKLSNFKSIYGEAEFDFENLSGLIKLCGNVGAGKSTLGEGIHFALFGEVKDINNSDLVSWGERVAFTEINFISNNKDIYIYREIKNNSSSSTLKVIIDGEELMFSNKRTAQQTLENEYFDVSKLCIEQLCLISFNNFKPIPSMNPKETRDFLDSIFGLYFLTDYSAIAKTHFKTNSDELIKLESAKKSSEELLSRLEREKNIKPLLYIDENRDFFKIEKDSVITIELIKEYISKINNYISTQNKKRDEVSLKIKQLEVKLNTVKYSSNSVYGNATTIYEKLKSGSCPTCGSKIDISKYEAEVNEAKKELLNIKTIEDKIKTEIEPLLKEKLKHTNNIDKYTEYLHKFSTDIRTLEQSSKNYTELISDLQLKINSYNNSINITSKDKREWNELDELLNKTIRYELFSKLIPSINMNVQHFINELRLPYTVKFKSDFSCIITPVGAEQEIKMSSLSTGQQKNFSTAIIFGILKTIISGINFNIYFLDELFSNMDIDTRDIMLSMLKDNLSKNASMFIINHAEMSDNFFDHVVNVKLNTGGSPTLNNKINKKYSTYKIVF